MMFKKKDKYSEMNSESIRLYKYILISNDDYVHSKQNSKLNAVMIKWTLTHMHPSFETFDVAIFSKWRCFFGFWCFQNKKLQTTHTHRSITNSVFLFNFFPIHFFVLFNFINSDFKWCNQQIASWEYTRQTYLPSYRKE